MITSIPGYQAERFLGGGRHGRVWLGRAVDSGDRVALKCIPTPSAAVATAARREAALLALLDHPNLIALRDFVPLDDSAVLVLELAEAGSLAGLLRRRDRLTPAEVVAAISPVAAALAHAHETGVLHGDVSAANILFAATGHPKLADLGVARMLIGEDEGLGTPAYLDPTVAAGGMAGPAGDVFALAAVALHALTGSGPWQPVGAGPATAEQVVAVAAAGSVVDLPGRLRSMPPAIAAVLARTLDLDPARRGSAAELALDLRAAAAPGPIVLAGGRIVEQAGRHSAARLPDLPSGSGSPAEGSFWDPSGTGPRFVPADLTRVRPPREPDVAASLRLSGQPSTERPTRLSTVRAGRTAWRPVTFAGRWLVAIRSSFGALPGALTDLFARRGPGSGRAPVARRRGTRAGRHAALPARGGEEPSPKRRPPRRRGLQATGLSLGVAVLAVGAGAALHGQDRADATVTRPASQQRASARALQASPARSAASSMSGDGGHPAPAITLPRVAAILADLDAVRARAYAERDAGLLATTYAAPGLVSADTGELDRSVPAGCGLLGVTTRYTGLRLIPPDGNNPPGAGKTAATATGRAAPTVTGTSTATEPGASTGESTGYPDATTVTVEVSVSMPSATLRCGGAVSARTVPSGSVRLRVAMRLDDGGGRIISRRRI